MTLRKPTKPQTLVEWFWAAGIIFGALIGGGVILRNVGAVAYSAAIAPVADSLRVEREARMEADRSRDEQFRIISTEQNAIHAEIKEVHSLLVRRGARQGERHE